MSSAPSHRVVSLAALVSVTLVTLGWFAHWHGLGLTLEEFRWQGTFANLASAGVRSLITRPVGTWRPLCGVLLVGTDRCGLDTAARHGLSALLTVLNATLAGALAGRIAGRRAALCALALALVPAVNDEVSLWLGGRCDLLLGLAGLLAAHTAMASARTVGTRAVAWSLATALFAGLAALSKETGLLLPLALAPCVPLPRTVARLAPTAVVCLALGVARTVLMGGVLGPYVGTYMARGPAPWPRNLAVGTARWVIGPALRPHAAVTLAVGALVLAAGVGWVVRRRRRPEVLAAALGVAVLFAPVALMPADRALYPVVLAAAVIVSVAVERSTGAGTWCVAGWLLFQAASTVVMQGRWVQGYQMRTDYVASLRGLVVPGLPLVLVGGRQFFRGLYLEGPSAEEMPGASSVVDTCRVNLEFPRVGQGLPTRPTGDGGVSFALPRGTQCIPTRPRWPVGAVAQRGDTVTVTLTAPAVVVRWDAEGNAVAARLGSNLPR